jgi:hypothetical protein
LVAQHSGSAEKDATTDKGKEWAEGTIWEGISKSRVPSGQEYSAGTTAYVTKREGKAFEGRFSTGDGADEVVLEFEGEVDVTGKTSIKITKATGGPEGWKKGNGRNIVGVNWSGMIDGKSVTLKAVQRDPDHPKTAATIWSCKLKLKEDK